MKYKFLTPMGELEVIYLKERPSSFFKADMALKRVLITPSDVDDFDAVMIDSVGRSIIAPYETALATSLYFSERGIPASALSVCLNCEHITVPEISEKVNGSLIYSLKCKLSYTKTEITMGGIAHTAYTSLDKYRTRILPLAPGTEMRSELVRGLTVAPLVPDAVRSIAYSEHLDGFRMLSSERCPTLDGVISLLGFLSLRGVRGRIRLYVGDRLLTVEVDLLPGGFLSIPVKCKIL